MEMDKSFEVFSIISLSLFEIHIKSRKTQNP